MSENQASASTFLLPVVYWPHRTGPYFWEDVRYDEVRSDFDLAAASGIRTLAVQVPWNACQRESDRVNLQVLRDTDVVLRMASDAGLELLFSVAVTRIFSQWVLPEWCYELVLDPRAGPVRVLRRLYEDPFARTAARRLVSEFVGEFDMHPATRGWVAGDGMLSTTPPRSAESVDEWMEIVFTGRESETKPRWHGVSVRDLTIRGELMPSRLAWHGVALAVRLDWMPAWATDVSVWAGFIVRYVRMLGGLPPLVSDTALYSVAAPSMSEEDIESTTSALCGAGAAGILWPSLFNYDDSLRTREPFSHSPAEMVRGLFASYGRFTSAGTAWLAQIQSARSVDISAVPSLDNEVRARAPEDSMRLAYREYTA